MGFKNQYPNSVNYCGQVTWVEDCGRSASSGKKIRLVVRNPSTEKPKFDTYIRCLAFGKNAVALDNAMDEVILITGRLGLEGTKTVVLIDDFYYADDEPLEKE